MSRLKQAAVLCFAYLHMQPADLGEASSLAFPAVAYLSRYIDLTASAIQSDFTKFNGHADCIQIAEPVNRHWLRQSAETSTGSPTAHSAA